jgi:two-component system NtrC family sensor kinase
VPTRSARQAKAWWLTAAIVSSIAGPLATFGAVAYRTYNESIQGAHQQNLTTVAMLREHALKVLETHRLTLELINQRIDDQGWQALAGDLTTHRTLKVLADQSPQIDSIWLFDAGGNVISNSMSATNPAASARERDYFQAHLAGERGFFVSDARPGLITGKIAISLSIPRVDREGRFDGVLAIVVYPDYFENFYQMLGTRETTRFGLVKSNGAVLVAWPPLRAPLPRLTGDAAFFNHIATKETQGAFLAPATTDGSMRLFAYSKLDRLPIYSTMGISREAVLASWRESLLTYGVLAALVAGLLCVLSVVASRRIQREQRAMSAQIDEERSMRMIEKRMALAEFTASVAHDFNNLLSVMTASLHRIQRRAGDADEVRKLAEHGLSAAERGAGLIQQMLVSTRLQSLKPERVNLNETVERTITMSRPTLPANIRLATDLADDLRPVRLDSAQLQQMVLNLVNNARDAMPAGGTIRIATRNMPPGEASPAGTVSLMISDNGTGMPAEVCERAFEPFFTTKPTGKGTGLGLSSVRGFILQSGGSIHLDSVPGQGTQFFILLPAWRDEEPEAAPPEPVPSKGLAMLFVDDNEEIGATGVALFRGYGWRAEYCRGAAAALERLETGPLPDLVLSDVVMPGGMDGVALARRIAARWPALPVVLCSGFVANPLLTDYDGPVMAKPFDPATFETAWAEARRRAGRFSEPVIG